MRWPGAMILALMLAVIGFAQDLRRMADAVKAQADGDRFMGSVLVAKGDAVVFEMSAGRANAEWNVPNSATTKFRIGSLTKQFTAAAVLLLEERGKLDVDDPIAKYLSAAPASWRPITLRQLLTHTSGMPDFTELPRSKDWSLAGLAPSHLFERVRDLPLDFEPGTKFDYSNTGYVLLGWVIGAVRSSPRTSTFRRSTPVRLTPALSPGVPHQVRHPTIEELWSARQMANCWTQDRRMVRWQSCRNR